MICQNLYHTFPDITKTRNINSHTDMHMPTLAIRHYPVTLTFDLRVNVCRGTAIQCTCTKFGVDSLSRFPFGVQTHMTDLPYSQRRQWSPYPIHWLPTAWLITNRKKRHQN